MIDRIKEIQKALKARGFNPGPADGVWGRKTIAALRGFQAQAGLQVDGLAGPKTVAALFEGAAGAEGAPGAGATPIVWFEEARRLLGTREKPGPASNHTIIDWASKLGIAYSGDDVPWCGLFVAHCVGATLTEEPLPNSPLMARAWLKAGLKCQPGEGAILVFWRGSKTAATGHVGFYKGEDVSAYHVLGGNQSDSVSVARIAKDRLLEARWPRTAGALKPRKVNLKADGTLSSNEQ